MEKYYLAESIKVICIKAVSFPEGIAAAFDQLYAVCGNKTARNFYGISYPEGGGKIIYRAAATENYNGEAAALRCESFTIKKGSYNSILIKNYIKNIPAVSNAFSQLLAQPGIDPDGYCLEIYESDTDVRCLVLLKN